MRTKYFLKLNKNCKKGEQVVKLPFYITIFGMKYEILTRIKTYYKIYFIMFAKLLPRKKLWIKYISIIALMLVKLS